MKWGCLYLTNNYDFRSAADVSEEMGDKHLQAQAVYSIGISAMIEADIERGT